MRGLGISPTGRGMLGIDPAHAPKVRATSSVITERDGKTIITHHEILTPAPVAEAGVSIYDARISRDGDK